MSPERFLWRMNPTILRRLEVLGKHSRTHESVQQEHARETINQGVEIQALATLVQELAAQFGCTAAHFQRVFEERVATCHEIAELQNLTSKQRYYRYTERGTYPCLEECTPLLDPSEQPPSDPSE
jgi:hypothetical protein